MSSSIFQITLNLAYKWLIYEFDTFLNKIQSKKYVSKKNKKQFQYIEIHVIQSKIAFKKKEREREGEREKNELNKLYPFGHFQFFCFFDRLSSFADDSE